MDSIGETLRLERQRHGLKLEQLSAQTCIGRQFLEAMETNRFEQLPGGLFTRSFLRQYARVLQLDEEQLMASFKEQFEEPDLPLPLPPPKSSFLRFSLLTACCYFVVAALVCGAVYELAENVWALRRKPLATPMHQIAREAGRTRDDPPSVEAAPPQSAGKLAPAPTPSALARPGNESGTKAPIRALFTATEPVWLSIDSDGKRVYAGVLGEHQSKELTAKEKLVALVGNAGGLKVTLNDKEAPLLGAHGEVRLVALTAAGLRVTRAIPASHPANPSDEQQPGEHQQPDEKPQF